MEGVKAVVLLGILPGGGAFPFSSPNLCRSFALRDRRRHRPDVPEPSVHLAGSTSATSIERQPNPPEDASSERCQPGAGRIVDVNLGGRTNQTASGPEMAREVREAESRGGSETLWKEKLNSPKWRFSSESDNKFDPWFAEKAERVNSAISQ